LAIFAKDSVYNIGPQTLYEEQEDKFVRVGELVVGFLVAVGLAVAAAVALGSI
jgi:hypothetical protein